MELKGSYTIEAALLMPLILGTIVTLLYMSFWLHDRAMIEEGTIIITNRYCNEQRLSNAQIKQKLEKEVKAVIHNKVIATKNISTKITVKNKSITVTSSGEFEFPSLYVVQSVFSQKKFDISITKSIKRIKPVDFIRNCRLVEDLLQKD